MSTKEGNKIGPTNLWNLLVMKRKNWWVPLVVVLTIGAGSMGFIGVKTYTDAPPIPDFISESGDLIASADNIRNGQTVFLKFALMEHGSMFGDGAGRGPDYTAEALHQSGVYMRQYYQSMKPDNSLDIQAAVAAQVNREIKQNRYDVEENSVVLTAGQEHAYGELVRYYTAYFTEDRADAFKPAGYISDPDELRDLTAFFFWGGWVCGVERPGKKYSYTHNWPYDETAGNRPTSSILLWSVIATLGLIGAMGVILFLYGRYSRIAGWSSRERHAEVSTLNQIKTYQPSAVQHATFKFFATAAVLLVIQVLVGILTIHDFLGLHNLFGMDLDVALPITVTRSWHIQLALLWISACWIGASIFVLSSVSDEDPRMQVGLINLLYGLIVFLVVGSFIGEYMGPMGMLGDAWNFLGNQGWEFVELGKFWQGLLFFIFALWAAIIARAVIPLWKQGDAWTLPKWLLYAVLSIVLLFLSGFVAKPTTNFVIADFWRWAVIHMWAEAFFEVFATIVLAFFMYLMGIVSQAAATRVVYIATLLFLGSGLLGISHNFYWNAKPMATLAIGSVFSTLQVVPLVLLTLEAWQFSGAPEKALLNGSKSKKKHSFGQSEAFLFLLAVNFWNFLGAGVFGFIINLPIVNYYEHGTYLTVNHGHAALMGVYGNLALAAIVFCSRYLIVPKEWDVVTIRRVFWSINLGLALMVLLDLFPAGIHQLIATLDHGLWYSRSHEFVQGDLFQFLTGLRIAGGILFVFGGVIPLARFMVLRSKHLRPVLPEKAKMPLAAKRQAAE